MPRSFADVRWIFFDVGYTLFDETPAWQDRFEAVSALLSARGRNVPVTAVWETFYALCEQYARLQWLGLCERLATSADEAKALAALSAGWKHSLETAYPASADLLRSLQGRYQLGVIANQSAGTIERLAQRNLGGYIDLVIGSAEAGVRKPDPAIFQLALDRAGCRPDESVMVGDRIDNDIRPAKALGMKTIHVRQGGSGRQRPRSAEETADATVDSIADVATLFGRNA
ncbi:MAG TPA: HAD family hydrolase [Tepidisphaeraceae bacterium]|jgi:HAD superfamily hydrolase (TIGR01662 family)